MNQVCEVGMWKLVKYLSSNGSQLDINTEEKEKGKATFTSLRKPWPSSNLTSALMFFCGDGSSLLNL
eukprot:c217_g1_i1 orf=2-202(-)